jgi:ribosomal-protein-alanine N-acetyltransferase
MPDLPSITSDRVIMRLPELADVPAILRFYHENEAHLAPFEPLRPEGFDQPYYWEARVRAVHDEFRADRSLRCFLFLKERPDEVIGTANFSSFLRGVAHYCNLGYSLSASAQGHGYLTEILRTAIAYVFDELHLHRIQANYMPHNVRSGKVLRRLGFSVEGYARDYLMIAGQWEDHVLTSLTNPRWQPPGK